MEGERGCLRGQCPHPPARTIRFWPTHAGGCISTEKADDESFRRTDGTIGKHLTRMEHGARQPRLAMGADEPADTKTQERTEGAATAVQAMRGDSCTTEQKVQDGPKTSITCYFVFFLCVPTW